MSVYISEVDMPQGEGSKLVLQIFPNGEVYDAHGIRIGNQYWSKAMPVPDHGRLIDANKLKDTLDYYIREAGWGDEINKALGWVKDEFIDSEMTVIPADHFRGATKKVDKEES